MNEVSVKCLHPPDQTQLPKVESPSRLALSLQKEGEQEAAVPSSQSTRERRAGKDEGRGLAKETS